MAVVCRAPAWLSPNPLRRRVAVVAVGLGDERQHLRQRTPRYADGVRHDETTAAPRRHGVDGPVELVVLTGGQVRRARFRRLAR